MARLSIAQHTFFEHPLYRGGGCDPQSVAAPLHPKTRFLITKRTR